MLPIRIRQLPRFVGQTVQRTLLLQRSLGRAPSFQLCYFSCRSYYRYLYCSLHSLKSALCAVKYEVWLFNDDEQLFTEEQVAALRALVPSLKVIPWPKSMGWGTRQIEWIWRAYAIAAQDAEADDVIARVDSDVFFFNDRIFQAVARSSADFVGDGHFVHFNYCQGGCYFLRARAVRSIVGMLEREPLGSIVQEVGVAVEDVVAQHLVRRAGLRTWMTWFMMFPDELRMAGSLGAWQRWKFSCVHFVMKNKDKMLDAYLEHVLQGKATESYALETGLVATTRTDSPRPSAQSGGSVVR